MGNPVRNYGEFLREKVEYLLTDPENLIEVFPGNLLGNFVRSDNTMTPAINVGAIPTDWAVSGLQCIIGRIPISSESLQRNNPDGYGRIDNFGIWEITLRQFPVSFANSSEKSETQEQPQITIDLAHDRLMAWDDFKQRSETINNGTLTFTQSVYLLKYNWILNPIGFAGPR